MASRKLAPDVISLIHHVKLNEAGWWRKAVGQVVLAVFWLQDGPISATQAVAEFERVVGLRLAESEIQGHIEQLKAQDRLIESASGIHLSSHARREMDASRGIAEEQQARCQAEFIELCEKRIPHLDAEKLWSAFSKALAHAVKIAGANLFHLLADGRLLREVDWPELLLSKFDIAHRAAIRGVLAEFLATSSESCRHVVLRHLSAHFFAESSRLRPETIEAIEKGRRKRAMRVVLDTNFIFSVLNLHDNPGDDSAQSLLNLATSGSASLEVRLYVLPGTLEEAKRSLIAQQRLVERIRATPNVARAALTQPLPSIARKYFDLAAHANGLSAHEYFEPYISDLQAILRDKGIHVLEIPTQIYNKRQDVVDDTLDEQQRENKEVPEGRRKGYEKILHDVVLWHAVKDRRIGTIDSPFDVEYWGVTIDWSLIGFDRRKRNAGEAKLPVVLHPSTLLQLIQFWIPRSAELEEGLVDTLRLPLLFSSFDAQDEKATIRVLEAISRFEEVDDIPESTLREILASQALRARLADSTASNDEVFELVREQLLSEHKEVVADLERATHSLENATAELKAQSAAHERVRDELIRVAGAREAEATQLEMEVGRRTEVERLLEEKTKSEARTELVLNLVALPMLAALLLSIVAYVLLSKWLTPGRWMLVATLGGLVLASAVACAPRYVSKRPHLHDWWLSRVLAWVGAKLIILPLLLALVGIYQGAVWDGVRSLLIKSGVYAPPYSDAIPKDRVEPPR